MLMVLKIIAFELVAGLFVNYDKNTRDPLQRIKKGS